jgi:hypothetical protein
MHFSIGVCVLPPPQLFYLLCTGPKHVAFDGVVNAWQWPDFMAVRVEAAPVGSIDDSDQQPSFGLVTDRFGLSIKKMMTDDVTDTPPLHHHTPPPPTATAQTCALHPPDLIPIVSKAPWGS